MAIRIRWLVACCGLCAAFGVFAAQPALPAPAPALAAQSAQTADEPPEVMPPVSVDSGELEARSVMTASVMHLPVIAKVNSPPATPRPTATPIQNTTLYSLSVPGLASEQIETGRFLLWIPDGVTRVRAVYADDFWCAGFLKYAVPRAEVQQWAREVGVAVITGEFLPRPGVGGVCPSNFASGAGDLFFRGLAALAAATDHPAIADAPVVIYGASRGGIFVQNLTDNYTGRVVAAHMHVAGGWKKVLPQLYDLPVIVSGGEKDTGFLGGAINAFNLYRPFDAPWALGVIPGEGHVFGDSKRMARAWFKAMLNRRLPNPLPASGPITLRPLDKTDAWLGDVSTKQIYPLASFPGDRLKAAWLPDQATAEKWRSWVTMASIPQ